MEALSEAHQILEAMVTHLGYEVTIEEEESEEGACLQVLTEESDLLIGNHGDRLDDLQYLVNRILQKKMQDPPRIRIDCDHFRVRQEEKLITTARELADKAKDSGKPMKMRPLNAYHRRIVHNALIDDDEVETVSPRSDERLKRILIQPVS
ncbi:MAG: R3H domain-containing nucleic acid-binding protein [Roseibacillus sp.]|nr:single-stranded DNA-binding protein [Deltaproteobacteria bacterium]MCS5538566.1 KH domain-containing protein [Roseibacillus sp.]MEE3179210.1 R3H domain-containing nucleic acid-binding protein [Verrucomicrobiota bacterium]NRB28653.1 KH domain-containing protein [Roseibacillus sp.]HAT19973.1 single-stranded DNA-binding protein [Verrucomicrobiales bacterium]|tara:strand:+ start:83 stop:535 length:453 start_codon:yes stop_codon:yes gene_type:complete